jgi:hypothetical protein
MRTDACRATAVRGEQSPALLDLRMRCLDRRLGQVRALARVFAGADRAMVTRAVGAVDALESLDGCADAEALTAAMPPPSSPSLRAWVDAAHGRLDRVDALREAGQAPRVPGAGARHGDRGAGRASPAAPRPRAAGPGHRQGRLR